MKSVSSIIKKIVRDSAIAVIAVAAVLTVSIPFASCRKVSHNGKLDGQWQVVTIENPSTGESVAPYPKLYYCFNLHVVQLTGVGSAAGNLRYDKGEGNITLDFPYASNTEGLSNFGINSNPITFHIEHLSGKKLVLRSPESIVTCRRF